MWFSVTDKKIYSSKLASKKSIDIVAVVVSDKVLQWVGVTAIRCINVVTCGHAANIGTRHRTMSSLFCLRWRVSRTMQHLDSPV